ncbi:hypothetical protein [Neisseria sp. CCUG12390]|uniref:hypothetical protein n=1 Tax=Neisseria sp. CCUG12390 TaxID=3392035 RepID=UPI003A0FBC1A
METYTLEKQIWTEKDFDQMGWHDARIYGFVFHPADEYRTDLIFDIDYILEWVNPMPPEEYFSFWVSPCTLKFENIYNLQIEIDQYGTNLPAIEDVELVSVENGIYQWNIELSEGYISFKSSGFKQFVRNQPVLIRRQFLSREERNGVSFSEHTD